MNWMELIILISIVGLVMGISRDRKDFLKETLYAAGISFLWVKLSGLYTYSGINHELFGVNLFPWLAWTAGLVLFKEIYEALPKQKNRWQLATGIYVIALFILEYVGYNYWGIQLASGHEGLFGIEMMHMPWWGQVYYIISGPIYLKLMDYLKVK